MKCYDRNQPLIMIHIPKTAGNTTRKVFERWFGAGFFPHYFNENKGELPPKRDIFPLHRSDAPAVIYGHFNRDRGYGIEEYYPDVKQFVTILRDPLETAISGYFFARKVADRWKDPSRFYAGELQEFLKIARPNIFNHFPRVTTIDNYKDIIEEYFIEIGVTEYLEASMKRIAKKLGMQYEEQSLGFHNVTERDQEVGEDIRHSFIEKNRLEYEVYDYVVSKFRQS